VDFKKLNANTKKDPYILPFTNDVINTIARHEVYSLLDGFYGYIRFPSHLRMNIRLPLLLNGELLYGL
jgi:hypothetical protein